MRDMNMDTKDAGNGNENRARDKNETQKKVSAENRIRKQILNKNRHSMKYYFVQQLFIETALF